MSIAHSRANSTWSTSRTSSLKPCRAPSGMAMSRTGRSRLDRQAAGAAAHGCPTDLAGWRTLLGAEWLDCHQLSDLTTTNNPYTDPGSLTGMGFPPPGSGTLDSHYTNATTPPVSGLQLDGYWPDGCNAFQVEPALVAKNGAPFIRGCAPPAGAGGTCAAKCHHDAQFVIPIPDALNGRLLTAGTP